MEGKIIQNGRERSVSAEMGETIMELLCREGAFVSSPCGGAGTCGKCKVNAEGKLSPLSDEEKRFLTAAELRAGVRLACRTRIEGEFTVWFTERELHGETRFREVSYETNPLVRALRDIKKTSFYIEDVLIGEDVPDAANLGLVVDIGTTTVACYLVDMEKGMIIGEKGFANPQSVYGADVISRIDKIMKDPHALGDQQKRMLSAVYDAAETLTSTIDCTASHIRAAVFCGNTVMEHIAAGINPSSIAVAPFTAPTLFGAWYDAENLGFSFAENCKIYFAPCFASYVGGDIACGIVASGLDKSEKNTLFIDIGTNGEIGLSTEKGLYFCSAAAGPALEGAHIRCGMSGTAGAISKLYVDDEMLRYETVGGVAPLGICGSGIIDACAVMLDVGLLDETGCIADAEDAEAFSDYLGEDWDGNTVFLLDGAREIYLCGKDIREIQLAKAAIAAGIRTLLHKAGLSPNAIDSVVLAGGFGSHINPESACRIGLIPREFRGKIRSVGNVAGAGAVMYLLSETARQSMTHIREKADYTELSGDRFFMEAYIDEMMFEE